MLFFIFFIKVSYIYPVFYKKTTILYKNLHANHIKIIYMTISYAIKHIYINNI